MELTDFHILALSGGGFRGLYSATVLAGIEERCKSPLASKFDLICGTSIGGVIALAIAAEIPLLKVCTLFKEKRYEIFPQNRFLWLRNIFLAKYSNTGLKKVLEELFGGMKIKELKHRVIIPAINYTSGAGQFIKTPHNPKLHIDGERTLVNVALSTSAAPTYFPMHKCDDGLFVDGGLFGNAPGFFGLLEAVKFLGVKEESIRVLSIGTLSKKITAKIKENPNAGYISWKLRMLFLALATQETSTNFILQHFLKDRYHQIDSELSDTQIKGVGLDIVTNEAVTFLEQQGRISLQNFLGTEISKIFLNHVALPAEFYQNGELCNK